MNLWEIDSKIHSLIHELEIKKIGSHKITIEIDITKQDPKTKANCGTSAVFHSFSEAEVFLRDELEKTSKEEY